MHEIEPKCKACDCLGEGRTAENCKYPDSCKHTKDEGFFFLSDNEPLWPVPTNPEPKELKARKKPIVITYRIAQEVEDIKTLEGIMRASIGDYIITGVSGEEYPCKPDIFLKTYDLLDPPENDGEKGEGIETSLEEDRKLLENWRCLLGHCIGHQCGLYNPPDFENPGLNDPDSLSEWEEKMTEMLLAAKERCVRAECGKLLDQFIDSGINTEFFKGLKSEILNPPQK